MKRKILLACSLLLIVAVLSTGILAGCAGETTTETVTTTKTVTTTATKTVTTGGGDELITVMNPVVENQMAEREALASRLDAIAGKDIYLIDIGWGGPDGAYPTMEVMVEWFADNYPTTTITLVRKKGSYGTDDPDLWAEVAAEADAAIIGICG
jgi:hypothetical protein